MFSGALCIYIYNLYATQQNLKKIVIHRKIKYKYQKNNDKIVKYF